MTIDDQIRDKKIQCDINKEAAKISTLSTGKLHKYEYLTGGDILPSNQQQIIEQAKFRYSPLGKAFEKQIKTIEDQGEKQIKAIQDKEQGKSILKYSYGDDDTPFISKQKEIFNKLVDERLEKITSLDEEVNSNDLICRCRDNTADVSFNEFDNAHVFINKIQDGKKELTNVKKNQEKFKSYLGEIKKGSKKSKEQKKILCTILKCFIKEEKKLLNFMMIIH